MRFAHSKCKTLLEDSIGSKFNSVLEGEEVRELDKFSYLISCISPNGRISGELSSRMQKMAIGIHQPDVKILFSKPSK